MSRRLHRRPLGLAAALAALLPLVRASAVQIPPARFGDGVCAVTESRCGRPPVLAVLSAFPAELAPLVERATVRETIVVGDRVLRVGTLGDVPVVLGLLGIGLVNAAATTRLVLDRFDVDALVVSGVAGSPERIGDVTSPDTWTDAAGAAFPVDPALAAVAREVAAAGVTLERCTPVPPEPPGPTVCLAFEPALVVGGTGQSSDPYGDQPLRCAPSGSDVFGCDVTAGITPAARGVGLASSNEPEAVDMETAAVAREAQARGVPFLAFRAVSDGAGDPLGLPGFPSQFFAYYRLAARNAAAVTAVFVERWGAGHAKAARTRVRAPRVGCSCDWERRATASCGVKRHAPNVLRATVTRTCGLLAGAQVDAAAVDEGWRRAALLAARPAARRTLGRACASDLAASLRQRADD